MDKTDRAIEKAKKSVEDAILNTSKKLAIQINQVVILATPVDTGRARANWIASLKNANTSQQDSEDKAGGPTIAKNNDTINSMSEPVNIHISNNLEYIVPLNNGHSKQAPAGFVETAVAVARASIR